MITNAGIAYEKGNINSAWGLWGRLSSTLASKINTKSVKVYITEAKLKDPKSIWNFFERPILENRGINIEYIIVK
ncbi:MAG: hypothetical protein PSN34_07270 [Urechidicola sp.]|nr:hypothetical protein [Urechidicola sp.]